VSDTPETDSHARGNPVVDTAFAQNLERDRARIVKQEKATIKLALEYKMALDAIAEDCAAWLLSEIDLSSVDFVKAIRKRAKEVTQ
jgi:tRNA (Thr-GGU) A37 N-methylase